MDFVPYINKVTFTLMDRDYIENLNTIDLTVSKGTNLELYDERMGPIEKNRKCLTCGLNKDGCLGHIGYIKLPYPIPHVNTELIKGCIRILNLICVQCACPKGNNKKQCFSYSEFN